MALKGCIDMDFFNNLRIARKLLLALGAIVLVIVVSSIVLYSRSSIFPKSID